MARLFTRLLFLALPFVAFLTWFEAARGGRSNNIVLLKRRLLEAAAARVEVLILGSSHEHSISPELVHAHAFNLASWGQMITEDSALARRVADRLPKLKLVLQPISYFSLQGGPAEGWRQYYYQRFWGIPNPDHHLRLEARNFSCWFLYGRDRPWAALQGKDPPDLTDRYDSAGRFKLDCDDPLSNRPAVDNFAESVRTRLTGHQSAMRTALTPLRQQELIVEIEALQERRITVALLQSPLFFGYLKGRQDASLRINDQVIAALCARFGVKYFDYSADPRFNDADFFDADHLSCRGGEKFARILAAEVVGPLLDGPP